MSDTDTFHAVYENLDCKMMYNPKREDVVKALQERLFWPSVTAALMDCLMHT